MKYLFFLIALFFYNFASAENKYTTGEVNVEGGMFSLESAQARLLVSHDAGCGDDIYILEMDGACVLTAPLQCGLKLVRTTTNSCEGSITKEILVNFPKEVVTSTGKLANADYYRATFTVAGDNKTFINIQLPAVFF